MFKKTILAHALTVAFMGAALTVGIATPAMAQSNASGTIFGDASVAGASVLVRNLDTNLQRRVTADAAGRSTACAKAGSPISTGNIFRRRVSPKPSSNATSP